MFSPSEVSSLTLAISVGLLVIFVFRKEKLPKFHLVYIAFFFVVCASFSTLIEGVLWYPFFNTLEHLSHALAGAFFVAACLSLRKGA